MPKYKITPLENRLIVKPDADNNTSALLVPDESRKKPQVGTVISTGPGKDGKSMIAQVGDKVFYRFGAGTPIPDGYVGDHTGLLMMVEGLDTLMVISEEANPSGL